MGNKTKKTKKFFVNHWGKLLLTVVGVPLLVFLILIIVALIIAATIEPTTNPYQFVFDSQDIDFINKTHILDRAERLAGALRIQTISYDLDNQEYAAFLELHDYLEKTFPLVHTSSFIKREPINTYSLLYSVEGSAGTTGVLPYLLISHMDVVPADPATWDVPPFSGQIVDNAFVYGRGAIDDKSGVVAALEALENILASGGRPKRSFYMAFGHDEEISGENGAQQLASALKARGVNKVDFLVDEGLGAAKGVLPGTDKPLGIISVTEKGHMTLELEVTGEAGHSSFPPKESAIGILAAAVVRLENHPQPSKFGDGLEATMLKDIAPHCSFGYKLVYGNLWLFGGLVGSAMEDVAVTNSFVRTTTAITIFNGGIKENVVPPSAKATVNLRVHPTQTISEVLDIVRETLEDDRVMVKPIESSLIEPLPISPSGPGDVPYHVVAASLKQALPDAIVVPGMFIAITDTRWYLSFTDNIYRLYPFEMTLDDTATIHGNNERISVSNYHTAVNFYYRLIKNADIIFDAGLTKSK